MDVRRCPIVPPGSCGTTFGGNQGRLGSPPQMAGPNLCAFLDRPFTLSHGVSGCCDLAVVGVSVIKMGEVSGRWFFDQEDQSSGDLEVLTV